MCGRFMLDRDIEDLLDQYKIQNRQVTNYEKGDIYPSQNAPIVMYDNGRILKTAKWGFTLSGKSKLVINARSESIAEKPMFKNSFHNARCVIPIDLFYEWKNEGNKNKLKHRIYLQGSSITSLGGIFKSNVSDKGEMEVSFVIITTEANKYMNDIHSRMPLIIEDDILDYWLNNNTPKNIINEIIKTNVNHELIVERDNEDEAIQQLKLF